MSRHPLTPPRKGLYYGGMVLTGLGFILFSYTFVSHLGRMGDFTDFSLRVQTGMATAFAGMACLGIGQLLMKLGKTGWAGSGLKLDPQQARRDLEPWSRLTGGMLKDALDEAEIDLKGTRHGERPFDEPLIKLEELQRKGLISEAEYAAARQRVLSRIGG